VTERTCVVCWKLCGITNPHFDICPNCEADVLGTHDYMPRSSNTYRLHHSITAGHRQRLFDRILDRVQRRPGTVSQSYIVSTAITGLLEDLGIRVTPDEEGRHDNL